MTSGFVLNILKLLSFCLFFIFCHGKVSAQVVTTISGYPVIDLSNFVPLGCILSFSEASSRRADMNAQTPSNSAYLGVGNGVSCENGTWNSKMSIKYQLMRDDHTVVVTDWANAYTLCKQYSSEGGSSGEWRLPTQREFLMVAALHPQLRGISGFMPFSADNYWSSTENDVLIAWYVTFSLGGVYTTPKNSSCRIRCVRDL